MPVSGLLVALLAALAQPDDQSITVVAYPWAPFISPMGEPFRARSADDNTLARWFDQADRNRDGALTPEEMKADAERFFATLDTDKNGKILPEELIRYEREVAPEIEVNSRWRPTRAEAAAERARAPDTKPRGKDAGYDGYRINGLQGAARYALLNIPQPVASADTDFDRAITLDEFRRAAAYRFGLLDGKRQGTLALPQLQALVSARPQRGSRVKHKKDERDGRIAVPVPLGD